jgi:hypothetical protein
MSEIMNDFLYVCEDRLGLAMEDGRVTITAIPMQATGENLTLRHANPVNDPMAH